MSATATVHYSRSPITGEIMDEAWRDRRAKQEQAIRESACDYRVGKLIALLEGVVSLAEEILDHKDGCDCAWHAEWKRLNQEMATYGKEKHWLVDDATERYFEEVETTRRICAMLAEGIEAKECTRSKYTLIDDCVISIDSEN